VVRDIEVKQDLFVVVVGDILGKSCHDLNPLSFGHTKARAYFLEALFTGVAHFDALAPF
jgi:hypothetical protein